MGNRHGSQRARASERPGQELITFYAVGNRVQVHAFGSWYVGEVVKRTLTKAHVRYTSGTGTTRVKVVGPEKIRPYPEVARE